MEIKRLDWDSQFFCLEVFGVSLSSEDAHVDVYKLVRSLRETGAGLAYFFLEDNSNVLQEQLRGNGAVLYDEKITYRKKLIGEILVSSSEVKVAQGPLTNELLELALLAGHDSRFRKDPRLLPYFESLYELWLTNSLNGAIADKVFVYISDNRSVAGMATCKVKNDRVGNIGLIATATGYQGKGIGKSLLQAIDKFYWSSNVLTSTVVTQKSNVQACRFYERSGFTEYKKEYVYHLWFV